MADAARELRLAPNTVSTLVGRLTAAGLLARTRAVSDGRSVRLTVTGNGAQRIAEWRDLRADLAGRALDQLTAGDGRPSRTPCQRCSASPPRWRRNREDPRGTARRGTRKQRNAGAMKK